ncbi:hypothetical protein OFAG_02372 [Oxalobacter formigenes HOxBLS]|uniref:Uncharacterized protein n=1 Tax=Oxalobacter paraformigenes TaxID=556268 RepID=T5LV16_9BURK|nr:hypothetical protein OFAG_02372 [Oxalobacter paraformigenes]
MSRQVNWQNTFHSVAFKKSKSNRLKFVIPLLAFLRCFFRDCFQYETIFTITAA